MRVKSILQTILLTLSIIACSDKDLPVDDRDFVAGDVLIGIKSTVPIDSVFDLTNEKEVFIDQMSGFFNYSTFPNDSLDYVINQLKDKVYLSKRGFKGGSAFIHAIENRIIVTEFFFEMDIEAQKDWLTTMNILKLKDLGNDTKNLLIKVTPGTEKFWMEVFKGHPYVTWVDLNYYAEIVPN